MADHTISINGKEYEFETHNQGYSGTQYVAVNVKCWVYPQVTESIVEKVKRLGKERAQDLAFEAVDHLREQWWDDIKDRVAEEGFGKIYSAGRCGGWLVFDAWTTSRLDDLQYDAERECEWCHEPWNQHAQGKCLFEATKYKSADVDTDELDRLCAFIQQIKDGLTPEAFQDALDEEYARLVQDEEEDHEEEDHGEEKEVRTEHHTDTALEGVRADQEGHP